MLLQLSQTDHAFGCALIGGKCLVDALDLVPSEDAASLLGGFIAHGFFARFDLSETLPGNNQDETNGSGGK